MLDDIKVIMNATDEEQSVKAYGNWFTLKPKQIKMMQSKFVDFLVEKQRHKGLVDLPKEFCEPDFQKSPEGKKIIAEKRKAGLKEYLQHLRELVDNNRLSLQKDLDTNNYKVDARGYMSDGEFGALELLGKYQSKQEDEAKQKIDKVKELEEKIKKG